jgi:hypothetical protein
LTIWWESVHKSLTSREKENNYFRKPSGLSNGSDAGSKPGILNSEEQKNAGREGDMRKMKMCVSAIRAEMEAGAFDQKDENEQIPLEQHLIH